MAAKTKAAQREAGRKSWVTRRANEAAQKRSAAAYKAWETRRLFEALGLYDK